MVIPTNDAAQNVLDYQQRYFLLYTRIKSDPSLCLELDLIFSNAPSLDDILSDDEQHRKIWCWGEEFAPLARQFLSTCNKRLPKILAEDVVKALVVYARLRYDGGLALAKGLKFIAYRDGRFPKNPFLQNLANRVLLFFDRGATGSVECDPEWVDLWNYVQKQGVDQGHTVRYHYEDEEDYYIAIERRNITTEK